MKNKTIRKAAAFVCALAVLSSAAVFSVFSPENVRAGEILGETEFNYKALPWFTTESSPAIQNFRIEDGAFKVIIVNADGSDGEAYDLQLKHRDLNFKAGHRYTVSFRAKSRRDGLELCSQIQDLKGSEYYLVLEKDEFHIGPSMGGNWGYPALLSEDWQTFTGEFTPTKDIEGAEWVFQYANGYLYGGNARNGDEIWFDDMSVFCETCDDCGYNDSFRMTTRTFSGISKDYISVNQTGYYPGMKKTAVLSDNNGEKYPYVIKTELTEKTYKFEVVNAESGEAVYTGVSSEGKYDADSGDKVFKLDFSKLTDTGRYFIRVGELVSPEFRIGDDIYSEKGHNLLTDSLNYFYQNRSGADIESKYITSENKAGLAHTAVDNSDTGYVQNKWINGYGESLPSDSSSFRRLVSGGWNEGDTLSKHVVNGGMALWTLQNMYEVSLGSSIDKFEDGSGTVSVPETGNSIPDILDETLYELNWMSSMVVPEDDPVWGEYAGMVYHNIQDLRPEKLRDFRAWDEHENTRILRPPTFAATLNYAACAAQTARLLAPYDSEKAADWLEKAKSAFSAYLMNWYPADMSEVTHPYGFYPTVGEELNEKSLYAPAVKGGNSYSDYEVRDDAYWAACELFVSASVLGDSSAEKYYKELENSEYAFRISDRITGGENEKGSLTSFNWGNTAAAGTMTLALHRDLLEDNDRDKIDKSLLAAADSYLNTEDEQGYGIPYLNDSEGTDIGSGLEIIIGKGYKYGSNSMVVNNAVIMAYAFMQTNDSRYLSGVSSAMDYILGTNPLSFSYITGYGGYHVRFPVHWFWRNEFDKTLPMAPSGVLSGGPNAGLQDKYVGLLGMFPDKKDTFSQRCYTDSGEAWSVNSASLSWNASLAWVVSFLQDKAGSVPEGTDNHKTPSDTSEIIKGDINSDGKTDLTDLSLISLFIIGDTEFTVDQKRAADLDGDAEIRLTDLAKYKQFLSKVIDSLE